MKRFTKIIDRVSMVVWKLFSFLFFGLGIWVFLNLLLKGEYYPSSEFSQFNPPKAWEVLWDLRGVVIAPAFFLLPGALFWWFASLSKKEVASKR